MLKTNARSQRRPALPVLDRVQTTPLAPCPPSPQEPFGYLRLLLAMALVGIIGLALYHRRQSATWQELSMAATPTVEVRSGTIEQTIRLTGSTEAKDSAILRAPYLRGRRSRGGPADFGLVLEELAELGARVKKNDPVATFDRLAMQDRLGDFRAASADSESRLQTLRA